ncbi:hypothetical protein [Actinophytocola sp.]|jgi:hypothetical protein|uniref:hypothetical protein n=1 Tax=Actinophytocola sp. TaxID=1872138 RepID=UPI002ED9F6A7
MSVTPARLEGYGPAPVDHLVLALHKSRVTRALRAKRDCSERCDFTGALHAEKNLNEELELLGRLLQP